MIIILNQLQNVLRRTLSLLLNPLDSLRRWFAKLPMTSKQLLLMIFTAALIKMKKIKTNLLRNREKITNSLSMAKAGPLRPRARINYQAKTPI